MAEKMFDGQRSGEQVLFVFRKHFLTARKGMLFFFIFLGLGILPLILWPGDGRMFFVLLLMIFVGLMGFFYAFIMWYFSIYIVTDQRIRQVSQKGIFKKTVIDLSFDKVQSISFAVSGLFASIFRYGTILIQTSAGDLVLSMIARPEEIYNKMQDRLDGKTGGQEEGE